MKANRLQLAFILIFLNSCFEVREPASPVAGGGSWVSPTEPSVLIDNFKAALTGLNVANYERCFVPAGFRFIAEPSVQGNNAAIFQRWTLLEEREYVNNLRSKTLQTNQNSLSFTPRGTQTFSADSLEMVMDYNLRVVHQDTVLKSFDFSGSMRIIMVRNRTNEWAINTWQDNREGTKLCWTELKQRFVAL